MFVYGPLLALRYRHPCFFSAANPGLYISGLGLESKFKTVALLPEQFRPRSVLIAPGTTRDEASRILQAATLDFPLIVKPDLGYRGLLVHQVYTLNELMEILSRYPVAFIVQEFLDYPEEVGVFYCRFPEEAQGRILSLTLKQFLQVVGNGHATVQELILQDPRALTQLERLQASSSELLSSIPAAGVVVRLGIVGNHSKGTRFINGAAHITAPLERTFDSVARDIPGFFYGRFDIKCESLEALQAGEKFKIIELNGIGSEPTHIYDQTKMSYPRALWTIIRHWTIVGRISAYNHAKGAPYIPAVPMLKALADLRAYLGVLKKA